MVMPFQLAVIALLLAGLLVLLLGYYTNPETTVGMMGNLMSAMDFFKQKLNEELAWLGGQIFGETVSGGLVDISSLRTD